MSAFRIPDAQMPSNVTVPFAPPKFPSGTDDMAAAPATPLQKCGLAQSDRGSMWKRGPGNTCTAFSPDLTSNLTLTPEACAGVSKTDFPIRDPTSGAVVPDADLTYKYTAPDCQGGWDVGAWGARQPSAGARLGLTRMTQQTSRPSGAVGMPKHFR